MKEFIENLKSILAKIYNAVKLLCIESLYFMTFILILVAVSIFLATFSEKEWKVYGLLFGLIAFLFSENGVTSFLDNNIGILNNLAFKKTLNSFQLLGTGFVFSLYLAKLTVKEPWVSFEFITDKSPFFYDFYLGSNQLIVAIFYTVIIFIITALIMESFIKRLKDLEYIGELNDADNTNNN